MKSVLGIGTVLAFVLLGGTATASYPVGIFARVHDVKFEPDATSPTAVKIQGDFVLVKQGRLTEPKRGLVYFAIVLGKEDLCRAEWADLKKLASTDPAATTNYVGFASSRFLDEADTPAERANLPVVHEKDKPDLKPVPYPLNAGLVKMRARDGDGDNNAESFSPVVRLRIYREKNPLATDKK
jgi:hypothetical protein